MDGQARMRLRLPGFQRQHISGGRAFLQRRCPLLPVIPAKRGPAQAGSGPPVADEPYRPAQSPRCPARAWSSTRFSEGNASPARAQPAATCARFRSVPLASHVAKGRPSSSCPRVRQATGDPRTNAASAFVAAAPQSTKEPLAALQVAPRIGGSTPSRRTTRPPSTSVPPSTTATCAGWAASRSVSVSGCGVAVPLVCRDRPVTTMPVAASDPASATSASALNEREERKIRRGRLIDNPAVPVTRWLLPPEADWRELGEVRKCRNSKPFYDPAARAGDSDASPRSRLSRNRYHPPIAGRNQGLPE